MRMSPFTHDDLLGVFTGRVVEVAADYLVVQAFTGPERVIVPRRLRHAMPILGAEVIYSARLIPGETRAVAVRVFATARASGLRDRIVASRGPRPIEIKGKADEPLESL